MCSVRRQHDVWNRTSLLRTVVTRISFELEVKRKSKSLLV